MAETILQADTIKKKKVTRFTVEATADFGRDRAGDIVIGALQKVQSDLVVKNARAYKHADGRPFRSAFDLELSGEVNPEELDEWVLESLRSQYGGPPFVVRVKNISTEEIEDVVA